MQVNRNSRLILEYDDKQQDVMIFTQVTVACVHMLSQNFHWRRVQENKFVSIILFLSTSDVVSVFLHEYSSLSSI